MVDTTRLSGIMAASASKPTPKVLTQAQIDAKTAEQVAAGIKSTSKEAKLEGETYAQANARLTAGYKAQPKPELTQEGAAAGATIQFVRTSSGGIGEFKEVFPIGTPIPTERTTAYGNTYDAQGNLLSGTGLKSGAGPATQTNTTLAAGGSSAGKDSTGKEVFYKIEDGGNIGFYYADGAKVPVNNLVGIKQAVDFANAGWSVQGLEKGVTPAASKYSKILQDAKDRGPITGTDNYIVDDVVVVRDANGVSLYNTSGSLISGKGSIYQIGIGTTDGKQINIGAVGAFGSPDYNLSKAFNVLNSAGSNVLSTANTANTANTDTISNTGVTTNVSILKAALRGAGFSASIIDSSTSFLNSLLKEGLDYDNATEVFLNSKDYTLKNGTKITSPFYTEYGYLNEGITVPKTANELFNTVEGFKGVVDKYKLSSKYLTQDALKSYVKNDVTVADLAERAGTAQLRALEADPFQVDALIKQGFIASAANLADFYLDPKVGKEQLELNRQTGVFTAEALRRTKSGISTSAAQLSGFKQLTATLAAKGYSEAQIAQLAGQGFENIAQTLQPTTQLAQIYEKAGGTVESNAALTENIQNSLLQEEFMGTASERRKRLSEQNIRAFQGSAGTTTGSLRQTNVLGIL
jgi:hypothetical protein